MAAHDKTEFHITLWLSKIIASCKSLQQLITAKRVIRLAEKQGLINLESTYQLYDEETIQFYKILKK